MNNSPASPNPIPAAVSPPPARSSYSAGPGYYAGAAPPPFYGDTPSDASPLSSLDPLRWLVIARKKWLTIVLALAFAMGAAVFYLSKTTRFYQSRSLIELCVRRPRILNKQEAMIEDTAAVM